MISNYILQGSAPLVCIALLEHFCEPQVVLNATDCRLGLFGKIGSKYYLLSRLNLVDWSAASTSL
jgi:hypothetical protein